MSPDIFWDMTLYEWSIWLVKIRNDQERIRDNQDFGKALIGEFMALYANCHRNESIKPEPFTRKDFFLIKGEEAEEIEESPKQTGEQLWEEAEIFKMKIHGRNSTS